MLRTLLALAVLLSLSSCFSSRLGLRNETTAPLVPYPVVTDPPPPHREQGSPILLPGQITEIDIEGFNPLFYAQSVTDPARPNAVFVGLALYAEEPPLLQWRLLHYPVPPDAVGANSAQQPTVLREEAMEVPDEDLVLRVVEGPSDQPPFVTWTVELETQP